MNKTDIQLEERTCECGAKFKALPTSVQKTCSSQCSGGKLANRSWVRQREDKISYSKTKQLSKLKQQN